MDLSRASRRILVESFLDQKDGVAPGRVRLRPARGQIFSDGLFVACPRRLLQDFPVGTRFRLKLKLLRRPGGDPYLQVQPNCSPEIAGPACC